MTTKNLPGWSAKHIANHLVTVINIYRKGGFKFHSMLMDNEFNKIKGLLSQYNINIAASNEHVGDIEQRICNIKERTHGICFILSCKKLPKVIFIHLVYFVTMLLNAWPIKMGISSNRSPEEKFSMKLYA